MPDDNWARRRTAFGAYAGHYDRARPSFPTAAVAWLCGTSGVAGPDPVGPAPAAVGSDAGTPRLDVVDLGAGTGKLTRQLLAAGHRVTAVEPSDGMRAVLANNCPGATVVAGSAESIPLESAAADVVTAAQAMHWFDLPLALPEIARVLRPGGRLSAVWNQFDDSLDWVAEFCDVTDSEARLSRIESVNREWEPWFPRPQRAEFGHSSSFTATDLVSLAESFSTVVLLPAPERRDLLQQVADLIPAGEQRTMPYVAVCYRAQRT